MLKRAASRVTASNKAQVFTAIKAPFDSSYGGFCPPFWTLADRYQIIRQFVAGGRLVAYFGPLSPRPTEFPGALRSVFAVTIKLTLGVRVHTVSINVNLRRFRRMVIYHSHVVECLRDRSPYTLMHKYNYRITT